MNCYIEWNHGPENEHYNTLITTAINASLKTLGVAMETEFSVMIIDNDEMQNVNKEQRGKDSTTDVLSFPMYELSGFDSSALKDFFSDEQPNPESNAYYMGDMLLSWDKIVEQSEDYGHSIDRELSFLVVHSVLHIFGYDHMNDSDEEQMKRMQKEILESIGLDR